MTFAEMPYHRPDLAAMKAEYDAITARLRDAADYETARAAFLDNDTLERHIATQATLASVRHSIDTRDEFYNAEQKFWDAADPELQTCRDAFTAALLASPFRAEFAAEYGELMFTNAEITRKAFSPAIVADMQRENELTQEYEKLLASAQIPFEGGVYTLSQLEPFKTDADDARRLAAWKAEGTWFKQNQPRMDAIYDELVHLRDGMGKKLGYEGYTTLGYYRMQRNCYTKADIEKFRAAVVKYLVPLADRIRRAQAERLGVAYPLSYADEALMFRCVRAALSQRRKTLANALSNGLHIPREAAAAAIERAGFGPAVRGEALSGCDFARLSSFLAESLKKPEKRL